MFKRLKNWIKDSKGVFTKEGAYLDYTEIHVFENGFLYGLRNVGYNKAWETVKDAEDGADEEFTYFHWGYFFGNRLKYVAGTGLAGASALKLGLFNV